MDCAAGTKQRRAPERAAPHQGGAAIVEVAIALPILLVIILGAIQFGLIYQAKATLNHASLQAARAGAVEHANPDAIRRGLARGLMPLYSPESSLSEVIETIARVNAELAVDARIRVLNPTREAFADFGQDVNGVREIPNDRLHARAATVGAQSGVNIQDANLLRVEVTYGYELRVPLVNWFITRTLLAVRGVRSADAFQQQLLRRTRLPVIATATVRMQSPARESGLVVALADLPNAPRFDAATRPPDDEDEEDEESEETDDGDTGQGEEDGSSLGDGFLGFGGGSGQGGGGPGPGSGGGEGGSPGGGGNSGNPQQCSVDRPAPAPAPPVMPPSEPVVPAPRPIDLGAGVHGAPIASTPITGATLPGVELPSLGVGNPIHVVTGNKYQREVDVAASSEAPGLMFDRHYNSDAAEYAGLFGAGWRHGFEAAVHVRDTQPVPSTPRAAPDVVHLTQADGRTLRFDRVVQPGLYRAQRASDGVLAMAPSASEWTFTWRWPAGRELAFDAAGRLRSIRDRGEIVMLHYDAARLTHVVDAQGRVLRFAYYANGRVREVAYARGATRYRYDPAGNLETVIAADGRVRRYHYEDERHVHHLTGVSLGGSQPAAYGQTADFVRIATWAYDEQGRGVLSTHSEDAGKVTLKYGERYTDVTNAFGQTSRYAFDWRNGTALVTEVHGSSCAPCGRNDVVYTYNELLQLTRIAAKHQPTLHYEYDSVGRLIRAAREVSGARESLANYFYDGDTRSPSRIERPSVNPRGVHALHIEYRADGKPTRVRETGFSPSTDAEQFVAVERTFTLHYDTGGRLRELDGPLTNSVDITRFEYDGAGRLIARIDPDGLEHRILSFDSGGRPMRLQISGSPVTELVYDAAGRLARRSQLRSGGASSHQYRYDALGRLEEVITPDGRTERIGYDLAQRADRHTIETGLSQQFVFAPDGQIAASALTRPKGDVLRQMHFAYDAQRRLIELRDGDGPPLKQFIYEDEDTRVDRVIDPLGLTTAIAYDALGRMSAITAADGARTQVRYDAVGRVTALIAPNDARVEYEFDDFGRRVREVSSDRGATRFAYDAASRLIEKEDARGELMRFDHSPGGRLTSLASSAGVTRFAYEHGRLMSVTTAASADQYKYNVDGELIEHRRRIGDHEYITSFDYDALGRPTHRRLPSGVSVSYEYNDRGALARIVRPKLFAKRTLIAASGDGALQALGSFTYGNGVSVTSHHDADGRLTRRGGEPLHLTSIRHDAASRIVGIDRQGENASYEYDAAHRLTIARTAGREHRYSYDANGNRVAERAQARAGDIATAYTYQSESNRLSGVRGEIDYDAAGNVTRRGPFRYEYNAFGRPTKVFVNDVLVAEYEYNAWGERIRKTVFAEGRATTTHFVYEDQRLIAETNDRGEITREYLYVNHHPVVMLERGVAYFIHTDHLGAPVAVTNGEQQTVWRAQYAPFGEATIASDPDRDGRALEFNLRFPGQYADDESGLHYNYMREYDPTTGRYLTPDPLGAVAGLNSYAYAQGDPINRFDSLGLYDEMIHYYMTYFLAIVAGLPQDAARTMAIAAQYIDENPLTMPTREFLFITYGANHPALPLYHFVMGDQGPLYGDRSDDWLRRFYSPQSAQLNNLFNSTDPQRLMELWRQANPNASACPAPWVINDARYQLFGEYLHAYEDTFAHRDRVNMPYGVRPNTENDPYAYYGGHTGLGSANPLDFEPPDATYNQDYEDDASECVIGNTVRTRRVVFDLSEEQCRARGGAFTERQTNAWELNELRTLRMQYEVLGLLQQNFAEEIAENRARYREAGRELPSVRWSDLAGRPWNSSDPERNARIGVRQDYDDWRREQMFSEAQTVLQRFNASTDEQEVRLGILNEWLRTAGFLDADGNVMRIEALGQVDIGASRDRWSNIGWIPAGSFNGVLLPRDEQCQPIRNVPGECDDRPRR